VLGASYHGVQGSGFEVQVQGQMMVGVGFEDKVSDLWGACSKAGTYLRLKDFVVHSTLGFRVIWGVGFRVHRKDAEHGGDPRTRAPRQLRHSTPLPERKREIE